MTNWLKYGYSRPKPGLLGGSNPNASRKKRFGSRGTPSVGYGSESEGGGNSLLSFPKRTENNNNNNNGILQYPQQQMKPISRYPSGSSGDSFEGTLFGRPSYRENANERRNWQ